jgi:hypothetical protein
VLHTLQKQSYKEQNISLTKRKCLESIDINKRRERRKTGTKNIGDKKDGELGVWRASDVGLKASKLLDGPCAAG